MRSPLASPFRGGLRNLSAMRGRGRGGVAWSPANLGLRAWYDAELGQPKGVGYAQLDGASGDYIYSPVSNNLLIAGDIEVVMRVKANDWTAAANQTLAGRYVTTGNQRSWRFYVSSAGAVVLTASADGTALTSASITPSVALVDGAWVWLRMRLQLTNGANSVATLETAADQAEEPTSWTANGTQTAAIIASVFGGTAPLEIGTFGQGTLERFSGQVSRCIVRDGFGGRTIADFNASDCYGPGYLNEGALPTSGGSAYVPLRGVSGDYVWTAHKTLPLAADLDVVVRISDWDGIAANAELVSTRSGSSGEITFRKTNATQVGVLHFESGVAQQANIAAATSATKWLRLTRDVDGGTGGAPLYTAYYSEQTTFDPNAVVWISGGSLTIGTAAGPTATTNPLAIGGPTAFAATGIHRVIVRSGIGGSVVADFNAAQATVFGQASDGYGNGWLIADPKHHGNWTLGLPKIYDRSGNGLAPATFGAGSNQPTWLPWKGYAGVYNAGSGSNVQTPDAAALDLTTEADVAAWWSLDDWTPSSTMDLASKWAASNFAYMLRLGTDGKLSFLVSGDGAASQTATAAAAVPAVDRQMVGVRATWRASDQRTQFFVTWDSPQTQSPTWVLLSEVTMPGAVASLFAGSAPLGMALTAGTPTVGSLHRLRVCPSIGGAAVADFVAASCGQAGYTGSLGNVWTVNRGTAGRKAVVQSPVASSARSVILHGTDDYIDVPAAAVPPMGIADNAGIVVAGRVWNTPVNFGRFFSSEPVVNTSLSLSVRSTFVTFLGLSDGTNTGHVNAGPTLTSGSRFVLAADVAARSASGSSAALNTDAASVASNATVGAIAAPTGGSVGRAFSGGSCQDFELEALLADVAATTATERGQLTAYYRGGL